MQNTTLLAVLILSLKWTSKTYSSYLTGASLPLSSPTFLHGKKCHRTKGIMVGSKPLSKWEVRGNRITPFQVEVYVDLYIGTCSSQQEEKLFLWTIEGKFAVIVLVVMDESNGRQWQSHLIWYRCLIPHTSSFRHHHFVRDVHFHTAHDLLSQTLEPGICCHLLLMMSLKK